MNTSYFARARFILDRPTVAICALVPSWYSGPQYTKLAPTLEMLGLKNSPQRYTELYRKQILEPLSSEEVYAELVSEYGENCILLCYEHPKTFCHRHLVSKWLRDELGVLISEFTDTPVKGRGLFKNG